MRDQLKIATAEAILAAAERVFVEQGPHATRMEDVAAEAGVAVGTLYNHFEDRKALLEALLESRRSALFEKLDLALDGVKGKPFREQLERFVGTLVEHASEHRRFFAALVDVKAANARTTVLELEARAQRVVQRGIAQKALRGKDVALLAATLVGILRGVIGLEIRANAPRPDATEAIVNLFLKGAAA